MVKKFEKLTVEEQEEKDEAKKSQFEEIIRKFVKDKTRKVYEFPANLNSHDRLVVHQLADEIGGMKR